MVDLNVIVVDFESADLILIFSGPLIAIDTAISINKWTTQTKCATNASL